MNIVGNIEKNNCCNDKKSRYQQIQYFRKERNNNPKRNTDNGQQDKINHHNI